MILFLDTSALVPLLVDEPTSSACGELWDAADTLTGTRLLYVEAVSALAMAQRLQRLSASQARRARSALDDLWLAVDVIELGPELMSSAASLAVAHGLRGYDAVHCAAATLVADDDLVAASGDAQLLTAWRAESIAVRDIHS